MDLPESARTASFTQPVTQVLWMLVVLGLVGAGLYFAWGTVLPVIMANQYLNGVIIAVFVFGVLACFYQVLQLTSSVSWIKGFVQERPGMDGFRAPRLLASMATVLRARGAQMQISSSSAGSLLGSVATRMDEARDITRYIINLLIFLGLLGTFYGLATTIPGVVETIQALNNDAGDDVGAAFGQLMDGLQTQLSGMGTAFASSLLGLAGSLVVGLLELFAGHGQNRFYRELEEWLSSITRVGFAAGDGDGGGFDQGVVATVLDHMVEQIDTLEDMFARAEAGRIETNEKLNSLADSMTSLSDRIDQTVDPTDALSEVAAGQSRLVEHLIATANADAAVDPESRMRLRSIDVQLLKLLEEISAGRHESMARLHSDLTEVKDAIRDLARVASPGGRR